MPPVVAALATAQGISALIGGGAAVAGSVIGSRASTGASKRAQSAQERAAQRAEAAMVQDRADEDRREAEDRRRWDVDQQNQARRQSQEDAILRDNLERAAYEDAIRYGKMVNLARLTGQPKPPPLPPRTAVNALSSPQQPVARPVSAPIMARPSSANASIAAPGSQVGSILDMTGGANGGFAPPQRMPLSQLVGRRRVI